ncbi:MarR family transcriptional regulator [Streptomyces sp. URMC 128]|uniref:MarR family transcriptional regulator n=1 Tax=Streptomyces sp. URMC 128 TaxID=3423404 RepID=UPI003F193EC0
MTSFEVLHLLLRRPGPRIQDIAEEFSITVGGTSKVVDRLEATSPTAMGPAHAIHSVSVCPRTFCASREVFGGQLPDRSARVCATRALA